MKTSEYFGKGSIRRLSMIAEVASSRRILLITGKESFKVSGAAKSLELILSSLQVDRFSVGTDLPVLSDVHAGLKVYGEFRPDLVIAVGGGSVIDIAKMIRICSVQEDSPEDIASGTGTILRRGVPLIAIPTTAGSGSEVTHFAVVFVGNEKFSVAHDYVRPEVAIVDPQLTYSMPPLQTAMSGMDAFSQALESLWSVRSSDSSRHMASEAMDLVLQNINMAVNSPSGDSREAMSKAAHLAGKAIDISKTTGPHALSYGLTTSFGIPHGQAVALTVGRFLEFNCEATNSDLNDPRGMEHVKQVLTEICNLLGVSTCTEGRKAITALMVSLGLETQLAAYGVTSPADCVRLASEVNTQRLSNNPRRATRQQLEMILTDLI